MISVSIVHDTRSVKKDGTSPLKLRIVHEGQTYHISLGKSVLAKDWNDSTKKVKSSCKTIGNITRFNAFISKKRQTAEDTLIRLQDEGRLTTMSFVEIKQHLTNKHDTPMLLAYGNEIIAQMKLAGKHGNARVYNLMLRSVSNFVNGKDFPMKHITYNWLKRYESWYLSKGNSLNGLSVQLRTLRALYNRAIKEKKLGKEYYVFAEYSIKNEATRKRAISHADLRKLKAFEPQTARQKRAKDYFFISFYLMGASFVDIAWLKLSNIKGERIEYKRRKTGRLHSIFISPALQILLNEYLTGKSESDFILNIITSDDPAQQATNVIDELHRYNKTLKQIGELCEIETPLTSYVARHTYATLAKYKGVPTSVISEALGHTTEEVTQVYLDSFDNEFLDKYHQIIIE